MSRTRGTAIRLTRTLKTIARSATDQVLVLCYTSGHFRFEAAGTTRRVRAGGFTFYDLSQETVIEAPAVDNISLAISRRTLEALFPDLDRAHGVVIAPCPITKVLLGMMETAMALYPRDGIAPPGDEAVAR